MRPASGGARPRHGEAAKQIDAVVAEVAAQHGRIDVLSNNAGIELVHTPAVWEVTDEEWERVFRVNMTGIFQVCRAGVPHMPEGGSIVNMASINSFVAWENDAPYTATKGALMQFTRALALDVAARGIRANCVCPGVDRHAAHRPVPRSAPTTRTALRA